MILMLMMVDDVQDNDYSNDLDDVDLDDVDLDDVDIDDDDFDDLNYLDDACTMQSYRSYANSLVNKTTLRHVL